MHFSYLTFFALLLLTTLSQFPFPTLSLSALIGSRNERKVEEAVGRKMEIF